MLINSPNISGSLTVTGNATISGSLNVAGGISAAITGSATSASYVEYNNVANKPTLVSGSAQVSFNGITDKPTLVSGSEQVSFNGIVDKPTLVSGSSQVTYSGLSGIPSGIVSSSAQIVGYNVFATTGSNVFQSNQTITGSLFITQNLVVAGSSSIQYISSSVVDIADNIITVNAFNPGVRFGGLAVADSGSSPRVSGSILFDSIKDQWIFVHESLATTSSVLLMGPETYNDLGNETYLSANRLPKGSGIEHLRDSNITDTGTIVSVNSNTQVTGSMSVAPSITVTGDGSNDIFKAVRSGVTRVVIKNGVNTLGINTDTINNPLTVNGGADFNGNVGIGYTSPSYRLSVSGSSNSGIFVKQGSQIGDSPSGSNFYSALTFENTSTTNAWSIGYSQGAKFSINYFDASSTYIRVLTATGGGNVGIGTINPSVRLSGRVLSINDTSANLQSSIELLRNGVSSGEIFVNSDNMVIGSFESSIPLTFRTQNNEHMRITSGGRVGIGLTDPGAILDVSHTAGTTNIIRVSNGAGNYRWRIDQLFSMVMTNASNVDTFSVSTAGNITTAGSITINSRTVFTTAALYDNASAGNNVGIGFGPNSVLPLTGDGSASNGTKDLGSSSVRWATVFTSDLSLSNGIGDYTIVEGENDLFLYNNKQNKVYKFVIEEVDPSTATPKKS